MEWDWDGFDEDAWHTSRIHPERRYSMGVLLSGGDDDGRPRPTVPVSEIAWNTSTGVLPLIRDGLERL